MDVSSEEERRESKTHQKGRKQQRIRIDREEVLEVEAKELPEDAQFKGYEEVIIQDIELHTVNIKFRRKKYYSPGEKKTYLAALPTGYQGQFGPQVKAWILAWYSEAGMSEPKMLELLGTVGLFISAEQLSKLLIKEQEIFHAEKRAVVQAGLESSPWQHIESTATRVAGKNEHCHVMCNPLYTAYFTLASKDRLSLLEVLLGGTEPLFRRNELALLLLEQLGVAKRWCKQLTSLLTIEQDYTKEQIETLLASHLPKLGEKQRKRVKDA